jgi:hypothetical protein
MPSWITLVIEQDELNLTPPPGQTQYQQPSMDTLVEVLDKHVAKARESLTRTSDDFLLTTNWKLLTGGQVAVDQPRHIVLRDTLNHLAHHRGQLRTLGTSCQSKSPSRSGPSRSTALSTVVASIRSLSTSTP